MSAQLKETSRQWLHVALGCLITALGLIVLKHSQVITGGTAGLSLGLSYLLHVEFYYAFILLNIPFVFFSCWKLGYAFTVRTVAAIVLLSSMTALDALLPQVAIPALVGSILGGAIIGVGVSFLFRSGASLGGSTILVIYWQRRYGWDPGKTNFIGDSLVVLASFSALSLSQGTISIVSIAVTSGVLSFYKNRSQSSRRSRTSTLSTPAAA
ncbi:YitT family protein [Cohnella endophytica]|uniref:YitT family protein n=1 Tax=Cohnella endophytica TaxID=2419778 RepID=A0A494XBM6_9BACL|nr:YitT family protein [Cohnella endophytica]RKP47970.1 YitT family protein [Cohnella endophytica]